MQHSTGKPTKSQSERIVSAKTIGCIACHMRGIYGVMADYHHLLSGGIRRGHDFGLALCEWHHRGIPLGDYLDRRACRYHLGPSLAEGSKPFHAVFGSDEYLLAYQNELLRDAA